MNQNKPSFMDSKTLVAIALVMAILFMWQKYLQKKYPDAYAPDKQATQTTVENGKSSTIGNSNEKVTENQEVANTESIKKETSTSEKSVNKHVTYVTFEGDKIRFAISSLGMGISNYEILDYKDRNGQEIKLAKTTDFINFQSFLRGDSRERSKEGLGVRNRNSDQPIYFDIKKEGHNVFIGTSSYNGLQITKKMTVYEESYSFDIETKIVGKNDNISGLVTYIGQKMKESEGASFLSPNLDYQTWLVGHGTTSDREILEPGTNIDTVYSKVGTVALDSLYFATAVVDRSPILPEAEMFFTRRGNEVYSIIDYPRVGGKPEMNLSFTGFIGPKKMELLRGVDEKLTELIDYGMFGWIAKPLLSLMTWLFSIFGNWGVAIILMTLIVRVLVLPFNIMSYKSMKGMAKLKPLMDDIKAKHKDDPAAMNQEVMRLYKENGVNPLGGCLPMLLQMPVFFALYRVLGNSIDLYQAPFMLWITDLSLKDPYYILPVLMGLTMFVQQKITPTTMDPNQAKVMMFLPIIFTLFMVSLPSGLTLYIFISTLFGIIQQMIFMRDKNPAVHKPTVVVGKPS